MTEVVVGENGVNRIANEMHMTVELRPMVVIVDGCRFDMVGRLWCA